MDRSEMIRRLRGVKIPILILASALLILLSTGKGGGGSTSPPDLPDQEEAFSLADEETRLEKLLQTVDGVGTVNVLLSCCVSSQTDYVKDEEKTVVLSVGSGKQAALQARTRGPEYLGAVVVCDGGDDPKIQWSVLEAVSRFTGLRSDQIAVLKRSE